MRRMKEKLGRLASGSRTSSSDSRNTAKNVLIDVLNIAKDTGGVIPGVSPFFGGILQVVQGIDKSAVNVKTLQKLEENIRSLQSIFSTVTGPGYPPDMHEDVDVLTNALNDSLHIIEEKRSHSRARLFADRNEDEADLQSLAVDIQSALTTFQISQTVKHRKQERLQEISSLLEKLPFVEDASFDSSQNTHQTCFEGTRVEILKEIQRWIDDEDSLPLFWLNGIAGTGKSTIAQTVASLCEQHDLLAANFFFSRMVAERTDSGRVLPTLAYQLARYDDHFKSRLVEALKEELDAGSKVLTKQMEHLILRPLSGVEKQRKIVIVLDALDECDEKGAKELLHLLLNPATPYPVSVRILVTSRPEAHIRAVFNQPLHHAKIVLHEIERSVIESDINTYVVAMLREIGKEFDLPQSPDWFSEADRKELVSRAGNLFIYAATAILFIGDKAMGDPSASMELLLHPESASDADVAYENLDRLYTQVLLRAVHGATTNPLKNVLRRYQEIVGTIVLLRDPLSTSALSQITGGKIPSIQAALRNLHSVIVIYHRNGDEIPTIYHPSFRDFITNPARCKNPDIHIDPNVHERRLAIRCLELLIAGLKRDIVGICDPSLLNSEVEGLNDQVKKAIPAELQYACKHWSSHLTSLTSNDTGLVELLETFATKSMLFWFEAMSLLDNTSLAVTCIKDAHKWAVQLNCGDLLKSLLNDEYRFILAYFEPVKAAALHVYHSALPFTPHATTLRNTYQHEMDNTIKVVKGVGPEWSACLNTLLGHPDSIHTVKFSSDGSRLASSSGDHTVRLWDAVTGAQVAVLEGHTNSALTVAFSPDDSLLASGSSDETVRLWDAVTGAQVSVLAGHTGSINTVAFSSDGSRLASGSGDETIRLWDVATSAQVAVLKGHAGSINAVAFSSDGSLLASGSSDKIVRLWDAVTGAQMAVLEGHTSSINKVAFSSDGSRLASSSGDHTIHLWDAVTGSQVAVLEGHTGSIPTITFSSNGSRLASGSSDETVRLWDARTGAQVAVLAGHTSSINEVTFSSDGSLLASGSSDKTVRLWDAMTGAQVAVLEGHTGSINTVAFFWDGSRVASGSWDGTIRLWDAAAGAQVAALESHASPIWTVAFSLDGSRLASGPHDGTVRLWDAPTGAQVAVLEGHTSPITTLAFSTDGLYLTSWSYFGPALTWSLNSGSIPTLLTSSNLEDQLPYFTSPLPVYMKDQWLWYSPQPPLLPKRLVYIPGEHQILPFAFTANQHLVALGCKSGQILLLDVSRHPIYPSTCVLS